jgi:hypothetical protein
VPAISLRDPVAGCAAYEGVLAVALDGVLAGDLGADLAGVERRVVESLTALLWLVALHRLDGPGRCRVCRPGMWRRRSVCTVYRALILHVRPSDPSIAVAVAASVGGGWS